MIKHLKKLHLKLNQKKMSVFILPYEEQRKIISNFNDPKDMIERSFSQKKCQDKINGRLQTVLYDLISMILYYPLILKLHMNSRIKNTSLEKADAIALYDFNSKKLMPNKIKKEYNKIVYRDYVSGCLDKEDLKFIRKIKRKYPYSYYFLIKSSIRVAMYSKLFKLYKPSAILSYAEYSFTSSILTEYCRMNGVKHINIMHGEKLYNIRDSFFEFDSFYVWDKHYINIFKHLRTNNNQFVIYKPEGLSFKNSINIDNIDNSADFKYYLAHPDKKDLSRIAKSLQMLTNKGYKVKIRPHPLLLDLDLILMYFREEEIELPKNVSIEDSILSTNFVIAEYSTVLNQGFNSKKEIVIDDVTNPQNYQKLKELHYIMISEPHHKLSEIIESE